MQKKNLRKKITLQRETLLQLNEKLLEHVAGGNTNGQASCFCTETCT